MKLSMIAPATETITVAGQEITLRARDLTALAPLLETGKFNEFLSSPARHADAVGAPFFALCVVHEGTEEEAKEFFCSLRAPQQVKLLQKCIDITFPPSEGEAPQSSDSSPNSTPAAGAGAI